MSKLNTPVGRILIMFFFTFILVDAISKIFLLTAIISSICTLGWAFVELLLELKK